MSGKRVTPSRKAKNDSASCIVIGIDFGTTYSGIAWTWASKPKEIKMLSAWQNTTLMGVYDCPKAPTQLQYNTAGEPSIWGYGAAEAGMSLKFFKLLLIDESDLTAELRFANEVKSARNALREANKEPVEVAADYLRFLWQHAMEAISNEVGPNNMATVKFRIVATIPAIWPMYAQLRMTEAIELAGMLDDRIGGVPPLTFISEPEAAALAILEDDELFRVAKIKKGDSIVICDAGGGTVDLITYTMENLDPMVVGESAKGDGKLCGAMALDTAFTDLLRGLIPRSIWEKMGTRGIQGFIHSQWEHRIKKQVAYTGQWAGRKWELTLPWGGTVEDGFYSPEVVVTSKEIQSVHKPVMEDICALVKKQISQVKARGRRAPKYVILVGGLGSSRYLAQYMGKAITGPAVLQSGGERPWSAVCRGAVLKGLALANSSVPVGPEVKSRVCRYHIGTIFNVLPWEKDEHDVRDKAWCPINQEFLAVDQVKWFAKIGDELSEEKPVKHTFWQDILTPTDGIVTEIVYAETEEAPRRCGKEVRSLCTICWSKVPDFESLPSWENAKGERVRHVPYEVRALSDGASLDFAIYHQGNRVASKNVSVDFAEAGVDRSSEITVKKDVSENRERIYTAV